MAKSNPYAGFEEGALKGILDAAGIQYPAGASQQTLADMVQETEKAAGKEVFAQIVASANNVKATVPSSSRSISPGTSVLWSFIPAVGMVTSATWDPPTPLEYGRTLT